MNLKVAIIVLSIITSTNAIKTVKLKKPGSMIAYSCNERATSSFNFDVGLDSYYGGMCGYQPLLGTILTCISDFAEQRLHEDPMILLNESFSVYNTYGYSLGGVVFNDSYLISSWQNASNYLINFTQITNVSELVRSPVRLNMSQVASEYYGYAGFDDNYDMSNVYGGIIILYWGLIFLISGLHKLFIHLRLISKFNSPIIKQFRKYFTLPSLFNGTNSRILKLGKVKSIITRRLDFFIIFGYIIVHIAVLSVRYWYDHQLYLYLELQMQVARWISDRTGIIAFAHIPLIILFGGRNNIFQWLTGFDYASFIQFHKWTGRVMFIDAMIHSAGYTNLEKMAGGFALLKLLYQEVYWQMGVVATMFGAGLVFQSLNFIRSNQYELFLFTHIVFALIFIWACWEHCLELGWLEYLYASIAVWCFDRLVRLLRLVLFGFPKATVSLVSQDTMKVVINKSNSIVKLHSQPGKFCFVYFMRPTMFWQSHPFTILDSIHNDNEIILFIKAKKGMTKRLSKYLSSQPDKTSTIRVSLEGPYGDSSPLTKYDKVLLLAGGNGIPGPLDHAIKLSRSGKDSVLLWATHNMESMLWCKDELKLLNNDHCQVHVYLTREVAVTGKTPLSSDINSSDENKIDEVTADKTQVLGSVSTDSISEKPTELSFIQFHYGRPDLSQVVSETLKENGSLSTAVITAGPDSFCGIIRKSVAENLVHSEGRVDLFEELQVW